MALAAEKVSYVLGPRDKTGRVIESNQVLAFRPDLVLAERQLDKARELFKQLDFHAAWQLAEPYTKTLPRNSHILGLAKAIYLVGQAYESWERFDWKQATRLLRKACSPYEGLNLAERDQIAANIEFLAQVAESPYSPERLYELYANAARRLKQGRYDDALARLYRAFEYLVQARLAGYEIDTSKIDLNLLKGRISSQLLSRLKVKGAEGSTIKIGLRDAMELAAELGDEVGLALMEMYWKSQWRPGVVMRDKDAGQLQNLLSRRNASFLAHGTDPAKKGRRK